ncbi:ABC transporter permease [Micromonospora globispora]|uniref:ABC transporter permease n=1 Tax=Micromonospora globispora TaxID=1450148 RepID=A0A317JXS6_9ACTN|nr:ABC transporter permease [Micromonospora globispora]PWU45587.1 ABC transporter permease [Micromonospora globispora]PWU57345.1 ABC transporter permease [Micromonospora globispora]RQX07517.1 ABC transporter permease [Micromonospora globispora]
MTESTRTRAGTPAADRTASEVAVPRRGGVRPAAVGLPALGLVIAVSVWWLVTSGLHLVHPASLPPPQLVWASLTGTSQVLLPALGITAGMTVLGFLLSSIAGVLIGMALAASRRVERMFAPLLVAVNAVPKIAFGPLLVVSVGWGAKPILVMVFLLCFFPIVLSTATGLTTTPADLADLARSLNASWWQSFRKVRLPAALPQIFVGLKVAMPLAAIGAVIGEFYSDKPGLGYQILQYNGVGDTATAWAAIVLIALMSILLYAALSVVERLALPWVKATTSAR